jgi:hypothetical protein
MRKMQLGAVLICALLALPASATHPLPNEFIDVALNGQNVLDAGGNRGAGDPDATGYAHLEEDHGTMRWEITYQNVSGETILGLHIHAPPGFGGLGDPFIDIKLPAVRPLPGGTMSGTMTSADDPGLQTKMSFLFFMPESELKGFYLDLHTTGADGFPNGAIRGELPEPSAAGLAFLSAMAFTRRRQPSLNRS